MEPKKEKAELPTIFKLVSYYQEEWNNSKKILEELKLFFIDDKNSLEEKFQRLSDTIKTFQNLHRKDSFSMKFIKDDGKINCVSLNEAIKSYYKTNEKDFYTKVLPFIIDQALLLEERAKEKYNEQTLPLMTTGKAMKVSIPKLLFLSIISNNFFCNHKDLDNQITKEQQLENEYPFNEVDWYSLYIHSISKYVTVHIERIICFLAFFDFAYKIITEKKNNYFEKDIIVERLVFDFEEIAKTLSQCENTFEESDVNIHIKDMDNPGIKTQSLVNFANRNFQTGQIIPSATQEEVLFCVRPELYAAMMICQRVNVNEIVVVSNTYKIMENEGYLQSFKFTKLKENFFSEDLTSSYDNDNENILCLDATFSYHYSPKSVAQDISKFYSACNYCSKKYENPGISTGSWGCGAFGCDKAHKFLQQLICAKANNVKLSFSTFGKEKYAKDLERLIKNVIKNKPRVCDLYKLIVDFDGNDDEQFHDYLKKHLGENFDIDKDVMPMYSFLGGIQTLVGEA